MSAGSHLILGSSSPIEALRDQITHLASFDAPRNPHVPTVLLLGETGTGKGLVARTIHEAGPRRKAPLVDVNCAAIPENMLEAELFGFEAGAFTDARRPKAGLFEAASGGTLFLDEIDALSIALQSKLLKAIEEKCVRRLGALEARHVDVKLIAATQRDLKAMVASGEFRPDLYHRLAVVVLEIPPLRERGDDAVLLAEHFLRAFAESHGLAARGLSDSAIEWLRRHPWSGNVRELSHLMERVTLMGPRGDVEAATLERLATPLEATTVPPRSARSPAPVEPLVATGSAPARAPEAADEDPGEAERIREALVRSGGNVVAAARLLGLGRNAMRYRMRRHGIARPRLEPASPAPAVPVEKPAVEEPSASASRGLPSWEHKAVAVLAIDLSFPDATVAGRDPWTEATRWQKEVEDRVRGFGGVLRQTSPSRLVALFGIPRVLEQGTQRAIHAAQAVLRSTGDVMPERRAAVHVGVVRVDAHAADPATQLFAVGDALSLPDRLLGHAGAGELLLSAAAGRRLRGEFAMSGREVRLGPAEADRVLVYSVVGARRASEAGALDDHVQARFVGRHSEMGVLGDAFAAADRGQGQVVFVVGEAGLGKSRLVAELRQTIEGRDHLWVEGRCAAYGSTSPFLPILQGLRNFLGIDDRDDEASATRKLELGLAAFGEGLAWTAPYVRQLLSLRQTDASIASLDSASRRSELFRALRALVVRAAEDRTVVLVVEDLHWIDPASEEFLRFLDEVVPAARILLVCSYRPGYSQPFGDRSYHVRIALRPLSGGEVAEVAGSLLQADALPPAVRQLVAEKAEGNPFFVEEVTKSLLEDGSLRRDGGRIVLAREVAEVAVPDTIQEVLLARIDRLADDARRAIQVASVIGREFALRLLERISETRGAIQSQLVELRALELIYEKVLHPELAYMFKHALTHEVAYESVVAERRRQLHHTIGTAIEELYADRLAEHYEALAHHFGRGQDWRKAMDYHARAAVKASESYANHAVIEHCHAALEMAEKLGEEAPRDAVCRIHELLGTTALYASRFALSARAFEDAAATAADPAAQGTFLALAGSSHLWAHQYDDCRREIDETRRLARERSLDVADALADALEGQYSVILQHDFESAERLCGSAMARAATTGNELAVGLTSFPNLLLREWSGEYDRAISLAGRVVQAGQRTGLANLVVWPTWFVGKAYCCLGQYGEAIAQLEEAYAVCDRIGDVAWKGRLLNTLGWTYGEIGAVDRARELNEQAVALARRIDDIEITANAEINLARNHLELGDSGRALSYLEPIEEALRCDGDPWMRWRYRMHAQNVRAEIELGRGELDRALGVALEEVAGARRHRAPKLEARALLVCGRTLERLDRLDEAEEALGEALAIAGRISHPRAAWRAHGALVRLHRRRGDATRAEEHGALGEGLIRAAIESLGSADLKRALRAAAGDP